MTLVLHRPVSMGLSSASCICIQIQIYMENLVRLVYIWWELHRVLTVLRDGQGIGYLTKERDRERDRERDILPLSRIFKNKNKLNRISLHPISVTKGMDYILAADINLKFYIYYYRKNGKLNYISNMILKFVSPDCFKLLILFVCVIEGLSGYLLSNVSVKLLYFLRFS